MTQILPAEIVTNENKINLNLKQQFKPCLQLKSVTLLGTSSLTSRSYKHYTSEVQALPDVPFSR